MGRPSDILVVGAGIVGCAVAYELSRRGASVEIIDGRPAGMGATQASAGILAPYIEAHEGSPLLELTVRSLELFGPFLECVVASAGLPVARQWTGTLDVARRPETMARLETLARSLEDRGVAARLLDAEGVREQEPQIGDGVSGGLLIPSHGYVAAHDFTRALAAAAHRSGARVLDPGRVLRISRGERGAVVETDQGRLTSEAVVLAGGSWSGQIAIEGAGDLPVRPVRGQLLYLTWPESPLKRVIWSEHIYLVPWEGGTVLAGATVEEAGFDERATAAGVRELLDATCELVPRARQAEFVGARVGLRPGTPDDLPVIGPSTCLPGVVYATGHYRNGVLLAPLTAKLVADIVLEQRSDPLLEWTRPQRFGVL